LVTQNPDFKLPHSSALLQHALGLGVDTACFDVNLGCSGYVYGLSIAKGLMLAEGISAGLVVTCDPYSRIMARGDRDTVSVFGDAASASWLSAEAGAEIGRPDYGTDGGGGHHLMVEAGGSARPFCGLWHEEPAAPSPEALRLKMHGRAIFNFMMERVPKSVQKCLAKNGLTPGQVDSFVFHQASKFMVESLRGRLRLDAAKVPCDIGDVGNTVSTSIPLLLSRLRERGALANKTVLVSGFGVGLSWATNILRFGAQ
jgi:3-oxoacyl-[acyl-carrier-protein] synthase-3